jgi:hypothetical protein
MLVDAESYLRKYSTSDGKALANGSYIVNWPDHIRIRRFNEHAEFYGPFKSRKEAQETHDWMYEVYRQFMLRFSVNDRYKKRSDCIDASTEWYNAINPFILMDYRTTPQDSRLAPN